MKETCKYKDCSGLTSLTIPNRFIGSDIQQCSKLTSLTVYGDEISSNCSQLIKNNPSLTSVTIKEVTSIGESAFSGCTGLTSINIPESVTSIGRSAFRGCSGLRSIYVYAETVPSTVAGAFEGCDSKNCTVYVPKGTYDAYWLSEWGDIFENIVEFDATNIRNIVAEPEVQENARYAVNGRRLIAPVKGINLVKYNNGRVKKEIVK